MTAVARRPSLHIARHVAPLACIAALCVAGAAHGQEREALTISGSVRSKVEAIDGQFRPGLPDDDAMLSFRTLIFADYDLGGVHLGGEIDDARAYGERDKSAVGTGDVNALEPIQLYVGVDVGTIAGQQGKGALKLGRFTFESGSTRLVERSDSSNSPATFLGAQFGWKSRHGDVINLFVTRPFDRLPSDFEALHANSVGLDRATDGLSFGGLSFTRAKAIGAASFEVYGMWLTEHDSPGRATRDRHLRNLGARLYRASARGAVDLDMEAVLQWGRARATTSATDTSDRDVTASMVHLEGGYVFAGNWSPRVSVQFDFASGDSPGANYSRFDPLFGSRRNDLGPTSLYGPLSRSNLISPGIALDGKPGKGWDFFVKGRALWLDEPSDTVASMGIKDPTGASGSWAGFQIETRARTWIVANKLRWEGAAAYLAKGGVLLHAPNAPNTGNTRYAYMMLSAFF